MDTAWEECVKAFLSSIEDISGSKASVRDYGMILRMFFGDENKSPEDYTRADVERFLVQPSRSTRNPGGAISPSWRNTRLCALVSFYKFASAYEVDGVALFQKQSPTQGLRYLKKAQHPLSISYEEFERFFAVIPVDTVQGLRDRAIYLTYFWTARRRSEIARLKWGDIEKSVIVDENGRRREGYVYHFSAKGRSRERLTAELPLPAWNAIVRYLEFANRLDGIQKDDPLFAPTVPGGLTVADWQKRPLSGSVIHSNFKKYAHMAGLDPRITIHSLRHMAAQQRYRAGEDLLSIKALLLHSSLDTTYRYLLVLNGMADSGAALLEQKFSKFS